MQPILSICMMVKNEEKNLQRCLESLKPLMQEVSSELLIIDTGSTDKTVEIAKQYTNRIYFHEWNNHFAEMRNITISYAIGKWIFIMDADEELELYDGIVRFLMAKPNNQIGCGALLVKNIMDENGNSNVIVLSNRIFRNNSGFHYRGSVHNEPVFKGEVIDIGSSLIHYGYIISDKKLMEQKFQRTSQLLLAELKKNPDNIYYRYQLGISYSMHGDKGKALEQFEELYLTYKNDDNVLRQYLYIFGGLLQAYVANNSCGNEVISAGLRGLNLEPEYIDLYYYLGHIYARRNEYENAILHFTKHLELINNFKQLKISANLAINHYTLYCQYEDQFNMALMKYKMGDIETAGFYLQKVIAQLDGNNEEILCRAQLLTISLDFDKKNWELTRLMYQQLINNNQQNRLRVIENQAEQEWKRLNTDDKQRYSSCFQHIPNLYGLLNRLRLRIYGGEDIESFDWELLISTVCNTDMNNLPDYYAPVLGYSIKYYPLEAWKISARLSEETIVAYMKYLDEVDKAMFVDTCRGYIDFKGNETIASYQIARLKKNITKYLLFSGELDDNDYFTIFKNYIKWGQFYMEFLYQNIVFEKELSYDLKNKEEVFLLYISLAKRSTERNIYLKYLNKALKAFPEMSKGINELLISFQDQVAQLNNEMKDLKQQLHYQIQTLLDASEGLLAKNVIDEYEQICGPDAESLMLKSQAMLLIN